MLEGHGVLLLECHHHLVTEAKQHQLQQREEGVKKADRSKEKQRVRCIMRMTGDKEKS